MAAFFKTPATPGRDRVRAAPRPAITFVWRLDDAGRPIRRWRAARA